MSFRYGGMARGGVMAKTCFDAVVSGERTSTTRFREDGPTRFAQWQSCRVGDMVRLWSGNWDAASGDYSGRSCIVEITAAAQGVRLDELDREAWSLAEGWSPGFLDVLLGQGRRFGLQVRYRLHTPPDDPQGSLAL